jgi:sec-independent protein translocase protein TatC
MAIQLARVHDKRKAKQRVDEGWDSLDDDEAAPFDYTPSDAAGNLPGEKVPEKAAESTTASEPAKRVNYDDAT